jgi:hypothetical protein
MPSRWKPNVTVAAIIDRVVDGRHEFCWSRKRRATACVSTTQPATSTRRDAAARCRARGIEETACRFTPDSLVGIYLSRVRRPANGDDVTYLRVAFGGHAGEPEPGRRSMPASSARCG